MTIMKATSCNLPILSGSAFGVTSVISEFKAEWFGGCSSLLAIASNSFSESAESIIAGALEAVVDAEFVEAACQKTSFYYVITGWQSTRVCGEDNLGEIRLRVWELKGLI